jgi:hypothetical protein
MRVCNGRTVVGILSIVGGVMLLGVFLSAVSLGQVPNWPRFGTNNHTRCNPGGAACATCGNGSLSGCTSPVPLHWGLGTCIPSQGDICVNSNYQCGPTYTCATGLPNGQTCPAGTICRNAT